MSTPVAERVCTAKSLTDVGVPQTSAAHREAIPCPQTGRRTSFGHRIRQLSLARLSGRMPEDPFHDPMLAVTLSGRATAPSEFLMRLLIKHLAMLRFGKRPALSRSGERDAPVEER